MVARRELHFFEVEFNCPYDRVVTVARIAVLHHARSFFPLDLFERTRETCDLIWVLDDSFRQDATTARLLRRLGVVVDIAGLDDDDAADRIARTEPTGIVTFVDDQIPRTAALAQRLRLRYHTPELAHILTDKGAQREALAKLGFSEPWFMSVPSNCDEGQLAGIADRYGFPMVVKPVSGMGSRGVALVRDRKELLELSKSAVDHVVEEYLPDRADLPSWAASYLSVETAVVDGAAHHLAVTGRFPLAPPFRETGNFIPAVADQDLRGELFAMVDRVVSGLRVRDSVLHTEIKLTPNGPRLIEINGRLGGRPGFVLSEVSAVNLFAIACQVAGGIPIDFDRIPPPTGVGFWLMLQPPVDATIMAGVEGVEDAAALDGVRLVDVRREVGERVDWRDGTDGQVVTIRGVAANHARLGGLISRLQDTLKLDYR
jgi:hypothetical protein